MARTETQNEKILKHMRLFGSITPREALECYGCMRLAARIADLRRSGADICAEPASAIGRDGSRVRFTRYSLKGAHNG